LQAGEGRRLEAPLATRARLSQGTPGFTPVILHTAVEHGARRDSTRHHLILNRPLLASHTARSTVHTRILALLVAGPVTVHRSTPSFTVLPAIVSV
jgi:hypothetical protein